jgi:ATP-dependent DNA helicase RecG
LREVIVNALVHSDYSHRGVPIRVAFYDDRIEIESPGILLPGLTIEEMKQGVSQIRNPAISRILRELELIEQWGSGVPGIFREARNLGLREPEIIETGMRLRFTVYLREPMMLAPAPSPGKPRKCFLSQHRDGIKAQSGAQSKAQSDAILQACADTPLSAAELMKIFGLDTKTGAFKRDIKGLLENELIEYTLPDKPNSRLQKYRLTFKGREVLATEQMEKE